MKIKICNISELHGHAVGFFTFLFMFWFVMVINYFSWGRLIFFLIFAAVFIASEVFLEKKPTIVIADDNRIRWKHIFGVTSVKMEDITDVKCDPFKVHTRYSSYHEIRLTIKTSTEDGEYILSDFVDPEKLVKDRLDGNDTDIPLIALYEFIKERIPQNDKA
ncbi:MAG: hypothetical protein ACI4Q6_10185 [Huintestinicola sp.]